MGIKDKIKTVYEHKYKLLMIFPILLLVCALLQIGLQTYTEGDFLHRGVSLKGGSTITLSQVGGINPAELESALQEKYPAAEVSVRTMTVAGRVTGLAVDSNLQQNEEIQGVLKSILDYSNSKSNSQIQSSVEVMGEALGSSFFRQAGIALIISFLLMGLVVIAYFRIWIPSLAVIICAFSDITVTMAIFNLTGIKLSSAGVAAFLMLIGYSIDTDILLTSRVLHRKEGTVMDRVYSSISTGMTMTITTIAVVTVALIFVQSETIRQIMIIILIGMFVDMIMTWIQNVGILRLYLERKERNNASKSERL